MKNILKYDIIITSGTFKCIQIFTIFIAVVESNVHEIELTNATYDIVTIIAVKYTYEHKAL